MQRVSPRSMSVSVGNTVAHFWINRFYQFISHRNRHKFFLDWGERYVRIAATSAQTDMVV